MWLWKQGQRPLGQGRSPHMKSWLGRCSKSITQVGSPSQTLLGVGPKGHHLTMSSWLIWLTFTRSSPPLEICRWFPQIVFILLPRVRPINVGFSNRFFCLSDKRFLSIIIKTQKNTILSSKKHTLRFILFNFFSIVNK